jgi:hypothetical protein
MKFTKLIFGVKLDFLELVQNKTYMLLMVLHVLGGNENVIDGTNHPNIHENNCSLGVERQWCIYKFNGHHDIFEMAITCLECCLSFEYAPNCMFHVYQSWCTFLCDSIDLVILSSKVKNINS